MGKSCSIYRERRCIYRFLVGKPDKRDHLEDTGSEERLILKCVFKRQERSLDWVDVTQDTDKWRAVVLVVLVP